ncbi:uncharacterized protein EV154DRAFT_414425, partial [Mucor mucedo]|uniref:uncharacterized protein n=1 Tax=Mucor mucedo TaxID=29922 RepID=UPI00221F7F97
KQKSLYKTELCRNWEETNHCRYGVKCQYAHGAADLRELDRHPKYKTQKCRTFHQTGACPYGARCTFRHFNLPGDALEMKNRDREEEEERQRELKEQQLSESKEDWFVGTNTLVEPTTTVTNSNTNNFMSEFNHTDDSLLLPSNAELLLPHELLFDLESPEKPARCPLRDYVNLPSFSTFQPHPSQLPQNAFFRPWLF